MGKDDGGHEVEQVSSLTAGQRGLLDKLTGLMSGQIGQGVTPYTGNLVAPFSNLQQQALSAYGGVTPAGAQGLDYYSQMLQGINPSLSLGYMQQAGDVASQMAQPFNPASTEQWFKNSVFNPAVTSWQDQLRPLAEKYASQNATRSGAFDRALAESMNRYLIPSLASTKANALYSGEQAQMNRQLQAGSQLSGLAALGPNLANLAGQAAGTGTNLLSAGLSAGALQQGQEERLLAEPYNQWQYSQPYNNPYLSLLGPALGTPAFENVISQQPQSFWSTMAPAFGSFAGSEAGANALIKLLPFIF